MSILQRDIPEARVLDLFAGSGALGLEALSRGARHVDLVDFSTASLRAIRANVETLGALPYVTLHREDALRYVRKLPPLAFDVAFADPPYRFGIAQKLADHWLATPFARVLGIEHDVHDPLPGGDTRSYGGTAITLYRYEDGADIGGT
ncbi:MAG: hypothetical protein MNPFHGCM_02884 [Gemmatimonadaceae bacterium]|nr:hypothetical protein [Gemmatimonadaceae bacterium]